MIAFPNGYGYDPIPDASPSASTAAQDGAAMASRVGSDPAIQSDAAQANVDAQVLSVPPATTVGAAYNVALSPLAAAIAATPPGGPPPAPSDFTPPVAPSASAYDASGKPPRQPEVDQSLPNVHGQAALVAGSARGA